MKDWKLNDCLYLYYDEIVLLLLEWLYQTNQIEQTSSKANEYLKSTKMFFLVRLVFNNDTENWVRLLKYLSQIFVKLRLVCTLHRSCWGDVYIAIFLPSRLTTLFTNRFVSHSAKMALPAPFSNLSGIVS